MAKPSRLVDLMSVTCCFAVACGITDLMERGSGVCEINAHLDQKRSRCPRPRHPIFQCWDKSEATRELQKWAFISQGYGPPFDHALPTLTYGGAGVETMSVRGSMGVYFTNTGMDFRFVRAERVCVVIARS